MNNRLKLGSTYTLLLLLLSLLHGNIMQAAETSAAYQPNVEYYLKKVGAFKGQGFIKDELKKYRSYPHLDRAYRLQRERNLDGARKEFEVYLTLTPEDVRSQISYLVLLDRMSLHTKLISQTDLILSRWPDFVPAYFFKGLALKKMGNTDSAFEVFSTAAAVKDIKREDRAFALSMAADLALASQKFENAGKILQALTEIDKKNDFYMKAGFVFEKSNHLKESLEAYTQAQKSAKSPAEIIAASLALAEVAKKMNNTERAKQAYEMVIENDSSNQSALRGLANIAYQGKRYDEAEKWMVLLKQNGLNLEEREFLANLHLKRRNYAAAIQELKVLLEQQGKKAALATLAVLAQAYESAGRLQESAEAYKALLMNESDSGEMHLRYANLLIRLEKFREAGRMLEKALLLGLSSQQKSVAQKNLALVYEKSGSYEKAAEELEKSFSKQPAPGGDLLLRRALLLNRADKTEEALQNLDQALAVPTLSDELKLLAYKEKSAIFEKAGQNSRAADELEKALQLKFKVDPEIRVRLAVLLNKEGRSDEAFKYLDLALADTSLAVQLKRVALREKGLILEKKGRRQEAAQEYKKAMALGDRSPGIYLIMANLYLADEKPELAIWYLGYLNKVIEHSDATNSEKCTAEDGFGVFYFKQGRIQEATGHLSTALQLCGENWQRRYYLGLAHYRSKQWEQALAQFLLADGMKKDPATLLAIALCHKELKRPGAAVHYLLSILQEPGSATPAQLKQIYDTLGYLYTEEYAYHKAADAFSRSLALAPDQIVSLNLANVYNLDGKTDAAWTTLNDVEPDKLSSVDVVGYHDLKSGLLLKLGRNAEALALMEKTQKLQATPSRSYSLGMLYQGTGQRQNAIEYFKEAYQKMPQQDDYALSLGYAYLADGRLDDAIGIFEVVAARSSDPLKVQKELGYLNSIVGKNDQAVLWFKKALDSLPVMPQGASEETARWENDAHRIRSEITKLTKTYSLALYASYMAGKAPSALLANGEQISGGLNGQVGIETSYRPPVVGLKNERILELFGRAFGNMNPNSLDYNSKSTQAGIGLRYKFLQTENLWISGERLIKIGKYAIDDWLLRLLYSKGKGFELLPLESNQDYYLLFGEVDGYLRSGMVAASAEVRKGRAFTLRPNYMLTPYFVLDGHWQSPFSAGANYLEVGGGISLKYFFNNTHYENFRNVIDFSINYKHGLFFNQGFNKHGGDYDSTLLSLGLFF